MRAFLPLLLLGLALLAGSAAWLAALRPGARALAPASPPPPASSPQLLPVHRSPQPDPHFRWPAPEPLEPRSRWVYGVFTPPRLYLERPAGEAPLRFRFAPAAGAVPAEEAEPESFGLRLVRAEPVPFRFQVVGVAGRGPSAAAPPLVLLADLEAPPDLPRVLALAPGESDPVRGVRLEGVERVVREPARGGVEVEYIARVRVGEGAPLRRLSSRSVHTVGDPVLYFAPTAGKAGERAAFRGPGEGGVFAVGGRSYRVDRVDPEAGLVRVSRRAPRGGGRWTEEWRLWGDPGEPVGAAVSPAAASPAEPLPAETRRRPSPPTPDPT